MRFPSLSLLAALPLLGLTLSAHATSFSLPSGSTVDINGTDRTITGTVTVNGSNDITGGSFVIDGLPTLGNMTFTFTSGGPTGGGNNVYDISNFAESSITGTGPIYYSDLVLYTLPVLKNGDIVICDGACSSGTDTASENSVVSLSSSAVNFSNVPISGTLNPATVAVSPEPSSLVLLGTGLIGAAGAMRRRFIKA